MSLNVLHKVDNFKFNFNSLMKEQNRGKLKFPNAKKWDILPWFSAQMSRSQNGEH